MGWIALFIFFVYAIIDFGIGYVIIILSNIKNEKLGEFFMSTFLMKPKVDFAFKEIRIGV